MSWIPGISQLKSVVQLITLDVDGAIQTQNEFLHSCPVVAQVTSLAELAVTGDEKKFEETNLRSVRVVSDVTDGIPVVGHVKGVIHDIVGDEKGAERAYRSANRSTAVAAGGITGGLVGGPIGAIAGGIAGGSAVDTTRTIVEDKPSGFYAAVDNVIHQPSGGSVFDAALVITGDAVGGYSAHNIANAVGGKVKAQMNKPSGVERAAAETKLARLEQKFTALNDRLSDSYGSGGKPLTGGEALKLGEQIKQVGNEIQVLEFQLAAPETKLASLEQKYTALNDRLTDSYGSGGKPLTGGEALKLGEQIKQVGSEIQVLETQLGAKPPPAPFDPKVPTPVNKVAVEAGATATRNAQNEQENSGTKTKKSPSTKTKDKYPSQPSSQRQKSEFEQLLEEVLESAGSFRQVTKEYVDTTTPVGGRSTEMNLLQRLKKAKKVIRQLKTLYKEGKKADEEEEDDDDDKWEKLTCIHWNCGGLLAQLVDATEFAIYVIVSRPDVIFLNELKCREFPRPLAALGEQLLPVLAGLLGYKAIHTPSVTPRSHAMRGSAVFYRESRQKNFSFLHPMMEKNVREIEFESVSGLFEFNGQYLEMASVYVAPGQETRAKRDQLIAHLNEYTDASFAILTGDLNMSKGFLADEISMNSPLRDTLDPVWNTNFTHSTPTAIDYVLATKASASRVRVAPPQRLLNKRAHAIISFSVEP